MDEKGFLLGQAQKVKVICCRGWKGPHYAQDGNREIVTVIQCISSDGRVIPPMYMYNGSRHLLGWHAGVQDKEQATFAWSTKGWTNNELGLEWVEQNFEKYTTKTFVPWGWSPAYADYYSVKSKPRILILDGYGSHLTWQIFDLYLKR